MVLCKQFYSKKEKEIQVPLVDLVLEKNMQKKFISIWGTKNKTKTKHTNKQNSKKQKHKNESVADINFWDFNKLND